MYQIRTILHATDFSALSDQAFKAACLLARDQHSRLVIVHVRPPAIPIDRAYNPLPSVEDIRAQLRTIRPADASIAVEHRLEEGFAADEIARLARDVGADVIVMGTHGHSGLKRAVLGSVAESVLRLAPCPVLTINPACSPVEMSA